MRFTFHTHTWFYVTLATACLLATAIFSSAHSAEMDNRLAARLDSSPVMIDNFIFNDLRGSPHKLYKMPGKVRMLHYWATWCAPCVHELPALDEMQAELRNKGLNVIAISVDTKSGDAVEDFLRNLNIEHLKSYQDPAMRSMRALRLMAIPVSIFIDKNGYEITRINGPADWSDHQTRANIEKILAEY